MQFPGLSANLFASVLPQALTGASMRAAPRPATFEPGTFGPATFESDLQSRDLTGAESFLSTLQQTLMSTGFGGAAPSAQIQKISADLTSGDLNAAQTDFSHLKLILAHGHATTSSPASSHTPGDLNPLLAGYANSAAFSSYKALQQDDVNRPAPDGLPALSLNA